MKKITFVNKQAPALNSTNLNQLQNNIEEVFNGEEAMGSIVVDDIACKNILPNNIQSQTINGVTIIRGEDGSLTFNGTATAYTKLEIVSNFKLGSGTYTFYFSEEGTLSGNCFGAIRDENSKVIGKDLQIHNSISINSFSLTETKQLTINITLGTNTTVTNFKIYPMLEKGSTITGYAKYKEFENKEVYSVDEKIIGTWVDGSPLYKKTIDFGILPNATSKKVAHNISGLRRIAKMEAIATNGDNFFPLPFLGTETNLNITIYGNKTNILITAPIDRSSYSAYVTLYYVKTTTSTASVEE